MNENSPFSMRDGEREKEREIVLIGFLFVCLFVYFYVEQEVPFIVDRDDFTAAPPGGYLFH